MGEDIGEDIEVVRIVGGGIIGGVYNTRESVLDSYVPHKSCNEHIAWRTCLAHYTPLTMHHSVIHIECTTPASHLP